MCSTCNHKNFETVSIEVNGRTIDRLEQGLGYGRLVIRCNTAGRNYYLAVKDEPKSEFKCYRCPTCGQTLD